MPMNAWIQSDDSIKCDLGTLHLVVTKMQGYLRFMVFRRTDPTSGARELLGSGTADNPRSAMEAAQRMAQQFEL